MDENKKEDLELEAEAVEAVEAETEVLAEETPAEPETQESVEEAVEESVESTEEAAEESVEAAEAETDSTFGAEQVESAAALEELISEGASSEEEADSAEEAEAEMTLASFAADCEMCATKVFFELEDLDDDGNLLCPNCNEVIEIDNEAIEFYRVKKETKEEASADYVADCPACEAVVHFTVDDIDDEENIVCPQCGEKIHIDTEVLDAYKQADVEKALKKKRILKKVAFSALGVVAALAVCVAILFFAGNKSVIKVDGTSVPMNIYKCVYYCENAVNYKSAGLDISKKPSTQKYDGEGYDTYDDLLRETTEKTLKMYYSIYNAGKKDNHQLTDKEKQEIEDTITNVKKYADSQNLSFEDYFKTNYGIKVSEKDFREYLSLSQFVNSYYKSVMSKDITEEQLKEIYEQYPDNYEVVSFRYYYVQIDDSTKKEDALKQVEAIAAAKSEKQFHELVKKFVSEDRAETYKDDDSTLVKDMACSNIQDRPVADLLTNAKSKVGQTAYGISNDGTFAEVAMVVSPRQKSDELIKNQAISEVASQKGEAFLDEVSKDATVKASIGVILRKFEF